MNGRYQQGGQEIPWKLKRELRKRAITQFSERELFHPEMDTQGRVVKNANISAVQLRKVFQEFKAIVDGLKKEKDNPTRL